MTFRIHNLVTADPGGRAYFYGRSIARIAVPSPCGGMDSSPLWLCCVGRGLCDGPITRPGETGCDQG
jgi:hypothetical protein